MKDVFEMTQAKVYTIREVADILRVDARTVRKLLDAEVIPGDGWFRVGRQIRVHETAVEKVMGLSPHAKHSI